MKVLVTCVGGQLAHDVVNELIARSCEEIVSDIVPAYSGVQDGTAVCASWTSPMARRLNARCAR